ncbi:unnamed protein product [Closterium sp. NIES-53]
MFNTSAVPIFTGQNYSAWKSKFQVLMMERRLWGFFDGMEKKTDNESDITAWKKKDQKAFATLILRIGINLVSSVRMCIKLEASAHEAWKRLETMHVNKTLHCNILARNAFYTVKMRAGELMHVYATRVEELGETFMDLGGTVTEEDRILTLLCGLPEEWSTAKGDVTKAIQEWALEVCDDDKKRIKGIRTDSGGEFVNAGLEKWMKSKGIKHDVTTPYTSQQNGAAERLNRTLVEVVRSLLQHSKLGSEWWGEASSLAAWIRNRLPTKVLPKTPFKAWTGTKLNLSRLRTFGCLCYYHVPDPLHHKLQPKAHAAIYLGIAANERAWQVWDLGERRVVTSRDVVFNEDKFPTKEQPTPQLTVVLPAQEEDEAMEVPSQVEKEAENGGGENEESNDDVVEVPSTAAATSSTPSSH